MLTALRLYFIEDGAALALKPCGEGEREFALFQANQGILNLHKKLYSILILLLFLICFLFTISKEFTLIIYFPS